MLQPFIILGHFALVLRPWVVAKRTPLTWRVTRTRETRGSGTHAFLCRSLCPPPVPLALGFGYFRRQGLRCLCTRKESLLTVSVPLPQGHPCKGVLTPVVPVLQAWELLLPARPPFQSLQRLPPPEAKLLKTKTPHPHAHE